MGARAATWRGLPGLLEQLPGRRFPPCSPGRPLPTEALIARRPLRTVITSGETPNSSRGRARLGFTPPGAHAPPEPRAGNTPAPGANSSRDKNVPARHGTAASAPHAQRRPHALPPRRTPRDSPSARPPRRGGEGQAGPGQTQYGRAPQLLPWLPAAASGTPSREQAAAAAVAAAAAPHPPPARWLPPLLPAPLPWQRGAKALGPAPPSVPPPAAGPGLPPASYQGGGRPSGLP